MKRKDGKKNLPGQGRKRSVERVFKEAIQKYIDRFPEITDELLAKALPQSISFKCKYCKKLNTIDRIPGTGDKEVLIHVNERVLGKVPNKLETFERGKQLDNNQLANFYLQIKSYEAEMYLIDMPTMEQQLKALPNPETSKLSQDKSIEVIDDNEQAYVQQTSLNVPFTNIQSQNEELPVNNIVKEFEKADGASQAQAGGETRKAMDSNTQGSSPTEYEKIPKSDSSDMNNEGSEDNGENKKEEEKIEHWTSIEPEEDEMVALGKKLDTMRPVQEDESVEVGVTNFG